MIGPQLSCIYSDDIRHEINGKITLVGCYGPVMYVPEFPFKLDKLGISFNLRMPIEFEITEPTSIEVLVNDEPMMGSLLDLDNKQDYPNHDLGEVTERYLAGAFMLQGLEFNEPTLIMLTAKVNGKQYPGTKLRILQHVGDDSPE